MERLRWITVKYTIKELAGGEVVTQRNVLERWKADNPGQEVKAHAGFKCNQEDSTVSMRIAVTDNTITEGTVAKIEGGVTGPITDPSRLLQPGHDKLTAQVEGLKKQLELGAKVYDGLKENYDRLIEKYQITGGKIIELHKSYGELKEASNEYIKALTDNRDALLTENENLKTENGRLILRLAEFDNLSPAYTELKEKYDALVRAIDPDPDADDTKIDEANLSPVDREAIRIGEDALQISPIAEDAAGLTSESLSEIDGPYSVSAPTAEEVAACAVEILQDAADLVDVKEVIAKDDSIDLDVFEDQGDEVVGTDTNTFDTVVKVACDQAEVVGPDNIDEASE